MAKWTAADALGLLLAWPATTAPVAAMTWFQDNMSKDGPIGWPAYILPSVIGLAAAMTSSLFAATSLTRADARLREPVNRVCLHIGCGMLAGFVLLLTHCVWWGDWCNRFAERFRIS